MAYATVNIDVNAAWVEVGGGKAEVLVQVINSAPAFVCVSTGAPAAGLVGHYLDFESDIFRIASLAGEGVYVRARDRTAKLAVTRG